MKLKKLIIGLLLMVIFISQISLISFNNSVYAVTKENFNREKIITQAVVPAEITMPKTKTISETKTLKIVPVVTETSGVQTYQWYKDDVELEGKTDKILKIENVKESDSGNYVLKVITTVNSESKETISTPCTVSVKGFTVSVVPVDENIDMTALKPGNEFEVKINLSKLDSLENGLISLLGKIEYDKSILDRMEIVGQNGWTLDANSFNEKNLKFIVDSGVAAKESIDVLKIKFKVKENITETKESVIAIRNISASGGDGAYFANDAELQYVIKIVEPERITSDIYNIDDEKQIISNISASTKISQFKQNVETKQQIVFLDNNGNAIENQETLVKTGMVIKVGETLQYTLVITGDIDGDGEITVNDLAKIKLHLIESKLIAPGITLMAADVDTDNDITINDAAKVKLVLIELSKVN